MIQWVAQQAPVVLADLAGKPMRIRSSRTGKLRCRNLSTKRWRLHRHLAQLLAHSIANARVAIALTAFVVTASVTTSAWRVAQPKKGAASTEFVDRLLMTPILTTTALLAHATGKTCARTTMGFLAMRRRNVCPIIASMGSAAATFAWAPAKPVRRRKKAVAATAFAATLLRERIPTVNAQAADHAMVRAHVRRASRNSPMVQRVVRQRNAIPGFVRTASVATVGVWAHVKPVRQREKTKVSTAYAGPLPTTKIRTKNAGVELATELAFASNTTAFLVRTSPNVCPTIASMDSAAETCATRCVLHVPRRRRARDSTAFAGQSLRVATWRANAIRANAMDRVGVISPKARKPMVRRVCPAGNALRTTASMAYVVTPRARPIAWLAHRPKKAAVPTAFVETSAPKEIPMWNAMAESATAKVFVVITTARPVRPLANASPIIASMVSAAATSVRALVKHAPRLKKATDSTAFVETSPIPPTRTTNAIPENAMVAEVAINRKVNNPMAQLALSPRNAFPAIASTACVVIQLVLARVSPVRPRKKAKAPMARAGSSSMRLIPTTNA